MIHLNMMKADRHAIFFLFIVVTLCSEAQCITPPDTVVLEYVTTSADAHTIKVTWDWSNASIPTDLEFNIIINEWNDTSSSFLIEVQTKQVDATAVNLTSGHFKEAITSTQLKFGGKYQASVKALSGGETSTAAKSNEIVITGSGTEIQNYQQTISPLTAGEQYVITIQTWSYDTASSPSSELTVTVHPSIPTLPLPRPSEHVNTVFDMNWIKGAGRADAFQITVTRATGASVPTIPSVDVVTGQDNYRASIRTLEAGEQYTIVIYSVSHSVQSSSPLSFPVTVYPSIPTLPSPRPSEHVNTVFDMNWIKGAGRADTFQITVTRATGASVPTIPSVDVVTGQDNYMASIGTLEAGEQYTIVIYSVSHLVQSSSPLSFPVTVYPSIPTLPSPRPSEHVNTVFDMNWIKGAGRADTFQITVTRATGASVPTIPSVDVVTGQDNYMASIGTLEAGEQYTIVIYSVSHLVQSSSPLSFPVTVYPSIPTLPSPRPSEHVNTVFDMNWIKGAGRADTFQITVTRATGASVPTIPSVDVVTGQDNYMASIGTLEAGEQYTIVIYSVSHLVQSSSPLSFPVTVYPSIPTLPSPRPSEHVNTVFDMNWIKGAGRADTFQITVTRATGASVPTIPSVDVVTGQDNYMASIGTLEAGEQYTIVIYSVSHLVQSSSPLSFPVTVYPSIPTLPSPRPSEHVNTVFDMNWIKGAGRADTFQITVTRATGASVPTIPSVDVVTGQDNYMASIGTLEAGEQYTIVIYSVSHLVQSSSPLSFPVTVYPSIPTLPLPRPSEHVNTVFDMNWIKGAGRADTFQITVTRATGAHVPTIPSVDVVTGQDNYTASIGTLEAGEQYTIVIYSVSHLVQSSSPLSFPVTVYPSIPTLPLPRPSEHVNTVFHMNWIKGAGHADTFQITVTRATGASVPTIPSVDVVTGQDNYRASIGTLEAGEQYTIVIYSVSHLVQSSSPLSFPVTVYPSIPTLPLPRPSEHVNTVFHMNWIKGAGHADTFQITVTRATGASVPTIPSVDVVTGQDNYRASIGTLEAGEQYTIVIYSVSHLVQSSSPLSFPVTVYPADVGVFNFAQDMNQTLIVQWTFSLDKGRAETFTITVNGPTDPDMQNVSYSSGTTKYSAVFPSLIPGERYNVSAKTHSYILMSHSVAASPVIIWPKKPSELNLTLKADVNISASWVFPSTYGRVDYFMVTATLLNIVASLNITYESKTTTYSTLIAGLDAGNRYDVAVRGVSYDVVSRDHQNGSIFIPSSRPGEVRLTGVDNGSLVVEWTFAGSKGRVEKFQISINSDSRKWNETISSKPNKTRYSFPLNEMRPGERYVIEVRTLSSGQLGGGTTYTSVVPPTTPKDVKSISNSGDSSVDVQWKFDSNMGRVAKFRVLLSTASGTSGDKTVTKVVDYSADNSEQYKTNFQTDITPGENYTFMVTSISYDKNSNENYIGSLIVHPAKPESLEVAVEDSKLRIKWKAGAGKTDQIYTTVYSVEIGAQVWMKKTDSSPTFNDVTIELDSGEYEINVTAVSYGVSSASAVQKTEITSSKVLPIALGILIPLLLVGLIVAAIFLYRRRRDGRPTRKMIHIPDDIPLETETAIPEHITNRRVKLTQFETDLERMHRDSNLLFSTEYTWIKEMSPRHETLAATLESNRPKNRYIDILAFDNTRVKLLPFDDDEASDYINASYIQGYASAREYIAAQGPLWSTVDEFWRMVWEQNSAVIVILTQCQEKGQSKCEQYWPEDLREPVQYGDIVVELSSSSSLNTYILREFDIKMGDTVRKLKQFHYLTMLDHGISSADCMVNFVTDVRSHIRPTMTGPIIIHCSAGVGRTGTFICVDTLMQQIYQSKVTEVDVYGLVLSLRESRPRMVQTESQYIFIHDCVNEILLRKKKSEEEHLYNNDFDNVYTNEAFAEEDIYENQVMISADKNDIKTEL